LGTRTVFPHAGQYHVRRSRLNTIEALQAANFTKSHSRQIVIQSPPHHCILGNKPCSKSACRECNPMVPHNENIHPLTKSFNRPQKSNPQSLQLTTIRQLSWFRNRFHFGNVLIHFSLSIVVASLRNSYTSLERIFQWRFVVPNPFNQPPACE